MSKKLKLAIYAGHGGSDSGAVGNGYHEDDLTLDIMKRTTKVLRNAGHTVINNRTSDVNRNISADAKLANRKKVDAVVEFHFDAAGASAEGTTGFYCATSSSSKRLAQCVNDKLDDVFKDRNVKPDTSTRFGRLGILRETNAVATLQEIAFITNKNDVAKYNAKADEVARKVAEGILAYFNQKLPVKNPNRHEGKVVDSAPLLTEMDFKTNPVRMYKVGTRFLVYEHNKYWYKTYINNKLYYMYKSFCVVAGKKDSKGRLPVRIKSAKDLRIPVWDNTKLNSGKIKWYKPGTKLAWYNNNKGYLELWYDKDGWYYTANYFLK
ncbi:N-acetylmuramoyl-L-alanine amidase [Listeria ivanovii subsp. londoniensis]|uniref:N-acetylmuramoyl-L-alanine amidase n=1 Tax=Listeria ivanovii TaxID=1638 RepID=UPI0019064AFD|nr:N-acetylmuramoyl-L-alanine amidase [Listeria ivanovii]MBK2004008.1 N-acetylmuramoyl-L-alanine amidase [Listeria ivanovii subsp. londoniensis]